MSEVKPFQRALLYQSSDKGLRVCVNDFAADVGTDGVRICLFHYSNEVHLFIRVVPPNVYGNWISIESSQGQTLKPVQVQSCDQTKRQTIVRQLREDVAELIKHGHEDKAFNRVGQIIKDECIVAVYELLDNFCEFILIHLPYIRRHKDCPNDINEAVSSLIYASARCGDLPELRVIRKLFGERYGQKFAVTALELFPGNLVNHQLIEKLSPKSVTDDMKQRLVNEIARNYCIKPEVLAIEYYSEWQQKVKEIRDLEYLIQMFRHIMKELKDLNCKL
ncbi:hypothetical protein PRUPE_5G187400 [Prunus persica]|uniref:Uncharacterized protein n=1 Tax=Prunus persica TaxID=3760 RepID=A0A251PC25_PRUPE|nr:hypothetical protein PRUPE_5G187400 [Prunus persica]